MDQIIETTINRFSKETGGLSEITANKGASERWVRINPYIAALREHLNVKLNKNKKTYIEMGCFRKEKDEEDVKNIGLGISDWVPDISDPKQPIVKINDGSLATQDMVKNILNAEEKGGEPL